jgi:hypothetical protein
MGNKIDTQKVDKSITDISQNEDSSETYLIREFSALYELLGNSGFKSNSEFIKLLSTCVNNMKDEHILNLIQSLIKFLQIQIKENINKIKPSFELLTLLMDCVYLKYQNLRELISVSISKLMTLDKEKLSSQELETAIRDSFPFNVVLFCIGLHSNEAFFNKKDFFSTHIETFETAAILSKVIYDIIYYQKNNQLIAINYIKFFDPFKIFLASNVIFKTETPVNHFVVGLFLNFFINFRNFIDENLDPNISKLDLEIYICHNFYLLLWFCTDMNKWFFNTSDKGCDKPVYKFENEFNDKIYKFSTTMLFEKDLPEVILNYNKTYTDCLKNILLYNANLVKQFIQIFYTNEERFTYLFKAHVKILIVYLFEINPVSIKDSSVGFL